MKKTSGKSYGRSRMDSGHHRRILLTMAALGLAAFVPIGLYNGKRGCIRGKVLKYAFYCFYPVHILLLLGIRYILL